MAYAALFELLKTTSDRPAHVARKPEGVIEKPAALPDVQLAFEEGLVGDLLFDSARTGRGIALAAIHALTSYLSGEKITR